MEAAQESHLHDKQNSQAQVKKLKEMLDQSSSPDLQRIKEVSHLFLFSNFVLVYSGLSMFVSCFHCTIIECNFQ